MGAAPGEVLICPGGQAALAACLRGLAAPGAPVLVEAPTYLGALAAARAQGLVPVPVPADERGIRPDLLADALERSGARLVYLQPVFANPHGATLDTARRAAVLEAVRAAGAFLIEDDAFRELAIGAAPPPLFGEDPDGHVVHLRSLTKPAAPGLRISAVIARGPALARLRAARIVEDLYVPGPMQEAALELVGTPAWRAHLRRLRRVLRERRDALAAAWGEPVRAPAGRHEPLGRPRAGRRRPRRRPARRGGRRDRLPGPPVLRGRAPGPFLRLTYASEPPDRLAAAVERLRPLLKPYIRGQTLRLALGNSADSRPLVYGDGCLIRGQGRSRQNEEEHAPAQGRAEEAAGGGDRSHPPAARRDGAGRPCLVVAAQRARAGGADGSRALHGAARRDRADVGAGPAAIWPVEGGRFGSTRAIRARAAPARAAQQKARLERVNVYATVREKDDGGATLRLGPLAHQAAWVAIEAFLGRPLDAGDAV